MWPIDLPFVLLLWWQAVRSVHLIAKPGSRRHNGARVSQIRGPLVAAALLEAASAVTAVAVTLGDAGLGPWAQHTYPVLGLVFGSAILAVAATGLAIAQFAWPACVRTKGESNFAWFMLALAFAIGSCYGVLMSPRYP